MTRFLVTAVGSMSAEAVVSSLERFAPGSVTGCNMHPRSWVPASRLLGRFHEVPPAIATLEYISRIIEICAEDAITHIVPLTDTEVDALTEHRQKFADAGIVVCISPPASIASARDKWAVHQTFSVHGNVSAIPTTRFGSHMTAPPDFPLLAKPRWGRSSEGHVQIPDEAALVYWQQALAQKEYVLQPLVRGDVVVVDLVRTTDGRNVVAMARRELLRTSNGAGMTVRMLPGHHCCAMALEVAETLDLHGCVNMEFLETSGRTYLMDVNPRFSAGVGFSVKAGYDMVANHVRCFAGEPIEPCRPPPDTVYARGYTDYVVEGYSQ